MAAIFINYDDPTIYQEVRKTLLDPISRNFVVEFGQSEAQVALNLGAIEFKQLLQEDNPKRDKTRRPVRWM
jgi:hypothetical protein